MEEFQKYYNYEGKPIECFEDLPNYLKTQVIDFIKKYDIKKLVVFGSYFSGKFHNENSSEEWLNIKRTWKSLIHKKFKKRSDLDCIVENFERMSIGDLDIFSTDNIDKVEGLVIYNNNNFI